MFPATPISNSYWVVPDRLLAGAYPGSHDSKRARKQLAKLLDAGIRTFIDLTEDHELERYDTWLSDLARKRAVECRHLRFAIRDMDVPDADLLARILGAIDEELAAGRPCLRALLGRRRADRHHCRLLARHAGHKWRRGNPADRGASRGHAG